MTSPQEEAVQRASAGHVYTDTFEEAIDSLEMTARFLKESETDPRRWKWVVIALHTAIQNFMVLVLRGSWDVATLRRDSRNKKIKAHRDLYDAIETGDAAIIDRTRSADRALIFEGELDGFDWLYKRIKDKDHWAMQYLGNDKVFEPGVTCDGSMGMLKELRDDYVHFRAGARYHLLANLALIAVDGLSVIAFLMSRDTLIGWRPDDERKQRAALALTQASASASLLTERYPLSPTDESDPTQTTASFFMQLIHEAVAELQNEAASDEEQDA